jgi:hypothetical protein
MKWFTDIHQRQVRFEDERQEHIRLTHPEMSGQIGKIKETLLEPDIVIRSRTDSTVELFYRHYRITPVTDKFLCVVVKVLENDFFIITAFFTDTKKRGETLWKKK